MDKGKRILSLMKDKQKTAFNIFSNAIKRNMKLSAAILGLMGLPMLSSEASLLTPDNMSKSMPTTTLIQQPVSDSVTSTGYSFENTALHESLSHQEQIPNVLKELENSANALKDLKFTSPKTKKDYRFTGATIREFYENIAGFAKEVTQKFNQDNSNNLSSDQYKEVLTHLKEVQTSINKIRMIEYNRHNDNSKSSDYYSDYRRKDKLTYGDKSKIEDEFETIRKKLSEVVKIINDQNLQRFVEDKGLLNNYLSFEEDTLTEEDRYIDQRKRFYKSLDDIKNVKNIGVTKEQKQIVGFVKNFANELVDILPDDVKQQQKSVGRLNKKVLSDDEKSKVISCLDKVEYMMDHITDSYIGKIAEQLLTVLNILDDENFTRSFANNGLHEYLSPQQKSLFLQKRSLYITPSATIDQHVISNQNKEQLGALFETLNSKIQSLMSKNGAIDKNGVINGFYTNIKELAGPVIQTLNQNHTNIILRDDNGKKVSEDLKNILSYIRKIHAISEDGAIPYDELEHSDKSKINDKIRMTEITLLDSVIKIGDKNLINICKDSEIYKHISDQRKELRLVFESIAEKANALKEKAEEMKNADQKEFWNSVESFTDIVYNTFDYIKPKAEILQSDKYIKVLSHLEKVKTMMSNNTLDIGNFKGIIAQELHDVITTIGNEEENFKNNLTNKGVHIKNNLISDFELYLDKYLHSEAK